MHIGVWVYVHSLDETKRIIKMLMNVDNIQVTYQQENPERASDEKETGNKDAEGEPGRQNQRPLSTT